MKIIVKCGEIEITYIQKTDSTRMPAVVDMREQPLITKAINEMTTEVIRMVKNDEDSKNNNPTK